MVCNADEGTRGLYGPQCLGGDPTPFWGMLIAGYAIAQGRLYLHSGRVPLAIERLKKAIEQAQDAGLLGENILGTSFSFHIHIARGPGPLSVVRRQPFSIPWRGTGACPA